jgi:hypothetical protein
MGIPPNYHSYAILPIGYPMGRFGPVGRGPLSESRLSRRLGQALSRNLINPASGRRQGKLTNGKAAGGKASLVPGGNAGARRRWDEVEFEAVPLGARAPASQRFTLSRSTLTWQGSPPPVVAAPVDPVEHRRLASTQERLSGARSLFIAAKNCLTPRSARAGRRRDA